LKQWPLIPIEAEPAQTIVDNLDGFGRIPRLICIFDAQDKSAGRVPRVEPVEKRGARAADVKIAGGRRREADPWGGGDWIDGVMN
jgi:hypothetical protein